MHFLFYIYHQYIIHSRFIRFLNVDYRACTGLGIKHLSNAWLIITVHIKHTWKMTSTLTEVITDWVKKKLGSFGNVLLQSMYTTQCWLNQRSCTWIIATSEPCLADICIYWVTGVSLTQTSPHVMLSVWCGKHQKRLLQIIFHTSVWF